MLQFGNTALIWACRKGHSEIVQFLLMAGSPVDNVGMYTSTALIMATRANGEEMVEMLLSHDAAVNMVDRVRVARG